MAENANLQRFDDALQEYFAAYFTRRDLEGIIQLAHPSLAGFGSGVDETAYSMGKFISFYRRDLESAPNQLEYEFVTQKLYPLDEKTAVFLGELDMWTTIQGQEIRLNNLRMLLVLHDNGEKVTLAAKHVSFPTQVHDADESFPLKELEDRAQLLSRMVEEKTKSLQEAYSELAKIINTDRLTSLSSRSFVEDTLEAEWLRYRRFGRQFCLLFIDLDDFKQINDHYGHTVGDQVLQATGKAIRESIRNTDTAGRWGGDEFMVIMPETSLHEAAAMVHRANEAINLAEQALPCSVSFSIGSSIVKPTDQSQQDVFLRADTALYKAKAKGKKQLAVEP